MTQENIKYDCWSSNGDDFHSDLSTVIDQLEVGDTIYEGVMTTPCAKQWVNADSVIEDIQCQANDECGEYAEDYLANISEEAKQELFDLIVAWANTHEKPHFWFVENVRERTLTTEDFE